MMGSSNGGGGGTSSGSSSMLPNSSGTVQEESQVGMDQRKRKRMLSNRESARRSRMRKQKHVDDLLNQLTRLKKENNQILTTYKITTQHYLAVEDENSVLRTQMMELNSRLQSLNDILNYINGVGNSNDSNNGYLCDPPVYRLPLENSMTNSWNDLMSLNRKLIMASADLFLY